MRKRADNEASRILAAAEREVRGDSDDVVVSLSAIDRMVERRLDAMLRERALAPIARPPRVRVCESTAHTVYAIRAINGGPIKFGKANNVADRIAHHQTGSPYILELVALFCDTHWGERAIHKFLRWQRAHGEWFDCSRPVLDFIAAEHCRPGPGLEKFCR